MKMSRLAGLGALLCLLPQGWAVAGAVHFTEPVAIVYSFTGEAMLTAPAGESRSLRLFERLLEGTTMEVGPGSRLALAFKNGRRYELGESSRVTLGSADLSLRSGPVHPLLAVPSLPRLSPIAEEEQPGRRLGGVRNRLSLPGEGGEKDDLAFIALRSEEARSRELLRVAVEAEGDGASLALLAEMDRSLGYLTEARNEFLAAACKSPEDVRLAAAVAEAIAEIERRLAPYSIWLK